MQERELKGTSRCEGEGSEMSHVGPYVRVSHHQVLNQKSSMETHSLLAKNYSHFKVLLVITKKISRIC